MKFIKKYWPSLLFVLFLLGAGITFLFVGGVVPKALALICFVGAILWWSKSGQQN